MNAIGIKIKDLYNEYYIKHGYFPKYCECVAQFVNSKEETYVIAINADYNEKYDNEVLFYCNRIDDLIGLTENSLEDFIVTDIVEFFNDL